MSQAIVRAAIHPGIGIARVGDGEGHVPAPQVLNPPPRKPDEMLDGNGLFRRESVEFRVYGYAEDGSVVRELTAPGDTVEWRVEMAATKAGWYKFAAAMDIAPAVGMRVQRRNPDYPEGQRVDLRITPAPMTLSGANAARVQATAPFRWRDPGSGTDLSANVLIGEAETDAEGRLVVLAGLGRSESPAGLPPYNESESDAFANATGWFDDIADGPVDATVTVDGREIPCEGAWVAAAPPNFAPDIVSFRTLLDMTENLWRGAGWLPAVGQVSFTRHILPMLHRLSALQWVNKGFATVFGRGGPYDFEDPALLDKLARLHGSDDIYASLRRQIARAFRSTAETLPDRRTWPFVYGDAFGSYPGMAQEVLAVSDERQGWLRDWAAGTFVEDWNPSAQRQGRIDDVPVAEQPAMLDRAPLHFCLADAFHPGCELTWPMRHLSLYSAPFRIRRAEGPSRQDYGPLLNVATALGPDGPLHGQGPGDLTRWMAIPWQVDTVSCRSGYDEAYDPDIPTFWPAAVPNQVLSEDNYAIVMDGAQPREVRLTAYYSRDVWDFALHASGRPMSMMIEKFGQMGVVERREGPADDPDFPPFIYVLRRPHDLFAGLAGVSIDTAGLSDEARAAREAGWAKVEDRAFFLRARHRTGV